MSSTSSTSETSDLAVRIRPAVTADDHDLARLRRRTWSPLHSPTPRPEGPVGRYFDATHRPHEVLVAEVDGRLAGYVRLVPVSSLTAEAHVRRIQGLAVDEWARGRGVGRALVRAACALAARQGARRVTLGVLGHNTPARRLYESAGFRVEGVLPEQFRIGTGYADDVLMGLRLDSGGAGRDRA